MFPLSPFIGLLFVGIGSILQLILMTFVSKSTVTLFFSIEIIHFFLKLVLLIIFILKSFALKKSSNKKKGKVF